MAYNNTYVALDKVTVGTATPSITFSSISQAYTDLVLVCSSTDSVAIYARLGNGSVDSGTNYSYTYLLGDGSTTASGRASNSTKGYLSLSSDVAAKQYHTITNFQNYSNTTTNKTFLTRYSDATIYSAAVINLWRSTSAVNIITVYGDGGNIPAGSTFSLYGIAATGSNPTAKATGGTITYTKDYTIHTFTSSGTFTPLEALSCDYLVIAGGGGGNGGKAAAFAGAGGGAGTATESTLSVTATPYTVTIGAGGAGGPFNTSKGGDGSSSVFASITATGGTGVAFDSSTGGANANYSGGTNVGNPAGAGAGSGANGNGINGGNGITSFISGSLVTRGGGGSAAGGVPGIGGGGQGRAGSQPGGTGTANTGSGGGGAGDAYSGGAGGSGIVIIRYAN